jgi:pimeloyl-ACP methyl ester carboxylesterase
VAAHIQGPLYYERMGREGPVIAFIHPNPMDQSSWIYQLAHLSTWYRCISIDIPGFGRSPKSEPGMTLADLADGCWEAIDQEYGDEPAVLVGCSAGSTIGPEMFHRQPSRTLALVLSGTFYAGDDETKAWVRARRGVHIRSFQTRGLDYRWDFTFKDFSAAYRATPLAHFWARLFTERDETGDVASILLQNDALQEPRADDWYTTIAVPTLILTGSEDGIHHLSEPLQAMIPNSELKVIYGAGHACQLEQPWLFNRYMTEFLSRHNLFPGGSPPPMASS